MGLTQNQINAINDLINAVSEQLDNVIHARDDVVTVIRFNDALDEAVILDMLANAKQRCKNAADEISSLLS